MTDESLASIRREYAGRPLLEEETPNDALDAFRLWFDEAVHAGVQDPTAMTLATAGADGMPDGRIVLLKGIEDGRFVFYTSFASVKGRQLEQNPRACLVFYWGELDRQVRVRGPVERLPDAKADVYFESRPRGSQLGAWASAQSEPLADRGILETRMSALEAEYPGENRIPRPPSWGGYAVYPEELEFWQGRPSRLHDRLFAVRGSAEDPSSEPWRWRRLSP